MLLSQLPLCDMNSEEIEIQERVLSDSEEQLSSRNISTLPSEPIGGSSFKSSNEPLFSDSHLPSKTLKDTKVSKTV